MMLRLLALLVFCLGFSPAAWSDAPAKAREISPLEQLHARLVARAETLVGGEASGTPEQRAHLLARLKTQHLLVEDNALCGDEGLPVHYSEINNQVLVCPRTAEAPAADLALAVARGVALSLSPCHAGAWLPKPGLRERMERHDPSVLSRCPGNASEQKELEAALRQAMKSGQAAFPSSMEWTRVWSECGILEPSPYHPLDRHEKFFDFPFGKSVAATMETTSATAILELLLQAKDKPASAWNWPACQEESLDAFARELGTELLK